MKRFEIAPGAFVTEVPGEKFKRSKILVNMVLPGRRENATELAILPHVLDRRCAAIPDATALSRRLYALYGADLTSESYTAGANRVVGLSLSGLKNSYALGGEDLDGEYLALLGNLLFEPALENGVFAEKDVEIEREKQRAYLKSEMNDKRGYCLRQARRKLYGSSPLGIESSGYLEDIDGIGAKGLFAAYEELLQTAQFEILSCGIDAQKVADAFAPRLAHIPRRPAALAGNTPVPAAASFIHYEEPMATVQGKLAILCTSAAQDDAEGEAVMRLGSALYGGLPTSRLFMSVREKQSLCYYCSSSYGFFSGTLTIDSGIDHKNARRASDAILAELRQMQNAPVSEEELDNAKRYMRSVFSAAKDSPDALMNFAFNEWLKGTNRSLDEMMTLTDAVGAQQVQRAMARFSPALEYVITDKDAGGKEAANA